MRGGNYEDYWVVDKVQKDTAIVIGYGGTNSTGLIRSLGEAGYRVVFASSYSRIESRYVSDYLFLPENAPERTDTLLQFLKNLPSKAALFTGDDLTNEWIEKNYNEFSRYCYCPYARGRLRAISDKTYMAQLAESVGLRIPETRMLEVESAHCSPIAFPVIMKPYAGYAGRKMDIRICRNQTDFQEGVEYLKNNGYSRVVIQKLLESDDLQDLCLMGCSLEDGTVKIPCAIRKIRSYPMNQGSLSFGCVENGILGENIDQLKRFVQETGYVGIFDIDMMVSDGVLYFIEINYRNGQNGYVSTAAGYNIPANWFRGMQGNAMADETALKEKYYMDEHCDYKHALEGTLSLRQWLKDLKATSVFAMYCPGDQRPFWRQYVKFPERWKIKIKEVLRIG